MQQLTLDIQPARPEFGNFIVGQNKEAIAQVQQLAISGTPQFIYLWGDNGSGKSHLLQAARHANPHLPVQDDVHTFDNARQIALFNQFNALRQNGGALLVAGNAPPRQMGLRDDLATRLAWGLVYQLHPLNEEEKIYALKHHAASRGMKLPDEIIEYCLRYLRRDISTLMRVLDALDTWSLTYQRPITLPLLRQILRTPL